MKKNEEYYKNKYFKIRNDYFRLCEKYLNEDIKYKEIYDNLLDDFLDSVYSNLKLELRLQKYEK